MEDWRDEPRVGRKGQINRREYVALREVLAEAMAAAGIGQRELSKKLGKPHVYIHRILNGRRTLEFAELLDICNSIGLNAAEAVNEALRRAK